MTDQQDQQDERVNRFLRWRERLRRRRRIDFAYRITVGIVGLLVLAVGIVAIPYPGPGWAIVFVGLGILSTEFMWARRALLLVRRRYDEVMVWFRRQHWTVQALGGVFTALVVVVTLWLLGALAWGAGLVGIEWTWLNSPIGLGS